MQPKCPEDPYPRALKELTSPWWHSRCHPCLLSSPGVSVGTFQPCTHPPVRPEAFAEEHLGLGLQAICSWYLRQPPTLVPIMIRRFHRLLKAVHPTCQDLVAPADLPLQWRSRTLNNYLFAQFKVSPTVRGNLEFIREFPGLLNAPLMGALSWMPETHLAGFSAWVTAIGMVGLGLKGSNWWLMLLCTIFWGVGSHLIMPVRSSLTMEFGGQTKRARRLGQVGAVGIIGSIIGAVIVWIVFQKFGQSTPVEEGMIRPIDEWQFDLTFYTPDCLCRGRIFFHLLKTLAAQKRPSFVLKRKYWLYYVLNVLFGARKQAFLTFGRWVIVTVYRQPPSAFAKLAIIASLIGIPFNQFLGHMVDRFGERKIMLTNAVLLVIVCLGYGTAEHLGLGPKVPS